MRASHLAGICLLVVVCLSEVPSVAADPQADGPPNATLTADDKKYLDGLLKDLLFDPRGAERVAIKRVVRSVWGDAGEMLAEGWFVAGKDAADGRIYFADRFSIPAPAKDDRKPVDFIAACKQRYTPRAKTEVQPEEEDDDAASEERFRKMRLAAVGAAGDDDLALAVWLYRVGEEELAARALAEARKHDDEKSEPEDQLRGSLAWSAFAGLVHAYMVRADDEALAYGEHLLRRYPREVKEDYQQATHIVSDLKRRQPLGTFGKTPDEKWPEGFEGWDVSRKVNYLISVLDEVDKRQWGQPGGVPLGADRRVEALVQLGDAAVPALIDAFEQDGRLTRSVHFWRDFDCSRTVLSVREAELTALMSILRVRFFEPAATGDNFTARGDDHTQVTAKRLRTYWKEYGNLPFDERMMKVLTDSKASPPARREAAANLATLTRNRRLGTTVWSESIEGPPQEPNPVIAKFKDPTVAEAMLVAMDADKSEEATEYVDALIGLGDKRIAPELARRASAAQSFGTRLRWAAAAHALGEPAPLRLLAAEFRGGKLTLSADNAEEELQELVGTFVEPATAETTAALDALADTAHPQHQLARENILNAGHFGEEIWLAHPFCIKILRSALDDITLTGGKFFIEKDRLTYDDGDGGRTIQDVPEFLQDAAQRRQSVAGRRCDAAAETLTTIVAGLPLYHALFKDADQRLATMKATLDRLHGRIRRATWRENRLLDMPSWHERSYVPSLVKREGAATADDVQKGLAIFHLEPAGMPAQLELPAVAVLKRDAGLEDAPHMLVLQVEVNAEGETIYGVVTRHEIRTYRARELANIKSLAQLELEEKAAQLRRKAGVEE